MGYVPRHPSETPEVIVARLRKYRIFIGCLVGSAIFIVAGFLLYVLAFSKACGKELP